MWSSRDATNATSIRRPATRSATGTTGPSTTSTPRRATSHVTRLDGHGAVTLPADYIAEHVELGYAATEPGNQSDTADRSITLATGATTCRGLYVAATRGRDENLIRVVTDTHDRAEAVDILRGILATDRADQPALTTQRELAAATPPAPALHPRCEIPDWFAELYTQTCRDLVDAESAVENHEHTDVKILERIDTLDREIAAVMPMCAPHVAAIDQANTALRDADRTHMNAQVELAQTGRVHRRAARREVERAAGDVTAAKATLDRVSQRARPLLDQRNALFTERDNLSNHVTVNRRYLRDFNGLDQRLETARTTLDALDVWRDWAQGHHLAPEIPVRAAFQLEQLGGHHAALARPLVTWCHSQGLIDEPTISLRQETGIRPASPGLGL